MHTHVISLRERLKTILGCEIINMVTVFGEAEHVICRRYLIWVLGHDLMLFRSASASLHSKQYKSDRSSIVRNLAKPFGDGGVNEWELCCFLFWVRSGGWLGN